MSSKTPQISSTWPPVRALTFWVKDCPFVYGSKDHDKAFPLRPQKVSVEKRARGVRIVVTCKTRNDQPRAVNFNVDGYPYQPAPAWLLILWAKAEAEVDHGE